MKKIYALLLLMFAGLFAFAQPKVDTIYHETFENPPFKVTTYGNPLWGLDSSLTVPITIGSPSYFYKGRMDRLQHPGDTSFLETDYFRTKDSFYVALKFIHIAKINPFNSAMIEFTLDSGKTWIQLRQTNSKYLGEALPFTNPPAGSGIARDTFNSLGYIASAGSPVDWKASNVNADSTMWIQEEFIISELAADKEAVKFRFKNHETSFGIGVNHTGWLIDDIIIEKAYDEVEAPIINHVGPIQGRKFAADSFKVQVDIDDWSGTHEAWLVYKVNNGAYDSIPMARQNQFRLNVCYLRERWEAYLAQPLFEDGDTICYYVTARDSSKLFNYGWAIHPDTAYCFIASGPPDLFHPQPVVGKQFAGNKTITAVARDGSGILEVNLNYSVNGGPYTNIKMNNNPPGSDVYTAILGVNEGVFDGDTACYWIEAVDASTRNNTTRLPEIGDPTFPKGCYEYINGGPPVVWLPVQSSPTVDSVLCGNIFNLGPFEVFAYAQDGTGINRVECHYNVNGGAYTKLNMNKITGTLHTYTTTIPTTNDSDLVCYFFVAVDQSPRENTDSIFSGTLCKTLCFKTLDGIKFPFFDDFEGSDIFFADPVFAGWERGTPMQRTIDHAFSGNTCWMTDLDNDYLANRTMYLESAIFKFDTAARNVVLSFKQFREVDPGTLPSGLPINDGDGFYIQYTTDVNSTSPVWHKLGGYNDPNGVLDWYNQQSITAPVLGPGWNGKLGRWTSSAYVLTNFYNIGRVKFRFVFQSNGGGNDEGVAVDDILLAVPPDFDLELRTILHPVDEQRGGAISDVSFTVANRGINAIDSVPVAYTINGGTPVRGVYPFRLNPGDSIVIPLGFMPSFVVPNNFFDLCAYTSLPGDGNNLNDTICIELFGVPTLGLPYSDDFESPPLNFISRGAPPNRIDDWERGIPMENTLNSAHSGTNVWGTRLDENYGIGSHSWLYTPFFDFSPKVNMTMKFWQQRKLAAEAGLRLEYTQDFGFTWIPMGIRLGEPFAKNWFNDQLTIPGIGTNLMAWTGNTNGWEESTYLLSIFDRRPIPIRFRYSMESNYTPKTDEGVSVDDFAILDPPPVDLGVLAVFRPTPVPALPADVEVICYVKNFGRDTAYNIHLNYSHAGTTQIPGNYIAIKTLAPGRIDTVKLPSYPSVIIGFYELCLFTDQPMDADASNDSSCLIVEGLPPTEAVMTEIFNPRNDTCYNVSDQEVCFELKNIGHSTMNSIVAGYVYTGKLPVKQLYGNINLQRDSSIQLCFSQKMRLPEGKTDIKVFVDHPALDRNILDDTIRTRSNAVRIFTLNYHNDFEDGLKSMEDFCLVESERNGRIRSRIRTGHELLWCSTCKAYSMQMGAQTSNPAWLGGRTNTTIFDRMTNDQYLGRAKIKIAVEQNPAIHLSFWKKYWAEQTNQVGLRILVNNQDAYLFNLLDPKIAMPPTTGYPTPWEFEDVRLDSVLAKTRQGIDTSYSLYSLGDTIDVEFQSKAELPNAVDIDSISIFNQVGVSAAVSQVVTDPPLILPNQPVIGKIVITNTGKDPISFVTATMEVNGAAIITQNFSFSPPLEFLQSSTETFSAGWTGAVGTTEICMFVANPNGVPDWFTDDDTLCRTDIIFENSTFPYCTDFEDGAPGWKTYNTENYSDFNISWELGDPEPAEPLNSFGLLDTAWSPTNCWMTDLDDYYRMQDSSGLYTPIFNVKQDSCYNISFYHRYDIDSTGDGGTFEYSYDGGRNWFPVGRLGRKDWYNKINIKSLSLREPPRIANGTGWTGQSTGTDGWELAQHEFKLLRGASPVVFRFRFGSDESNFMDQDHEGWAVDDFCFELLPGGCQPLGIAEVDLDGFLVDPSYPNPSKGLSYINYYLPEAGNVKLVLRDAIGKLLFTENLGRQVPGQQQYELDLKKYANGMYFYTLEYQEHKVTRKLNLIK